MSYVRERFELETVSDITSITPHWGYGQFSEFIYYNNYSRLQYIDGIAFGQESWHDTVIRVIEGVFSIRKDWYIRNRIHWDESFWQDYACAMGASMCRMEWIPPGRGLWAMGTDLIYERGAMALYNCAYTAIGVDWIDDVCWIMDTLMYGVGVGFGVVRKGLQLEHPSRTHTYVIPDTREGWVESVRQLLTAFRDGGSLPEFDYSSIRPKGSPIVTFGGVASGPEPLIRLHETIVELCYKYITGEIDEVAIKTDLANLVGVCVITGNVRRSAELACCELDDPIFMSLKDYKKHPYRQGWGWMSNNTVRLREDEDFEFLDVIAQSNTEGHDIGYMNMRNIPHGRIGKFNDAAEFGIRSDAAEGLNPCGEIPLEHREVCNLAETAPTRCVDEERWYSACRFASTYCSTVTLLPTHQPLTNRVINRNRRIGVSIIDFTGWKHEQGTRKVVRFLREGYSAVRDTNRRLAAEAGIPESIRVTTVKPGGTVPKVVGRVSGIGHPTFKYTLRRVNVRKDHPISNLLKAANVPYEESAYTPDTTYVFEFPIEQGPAEPASEVSIWEQAMNLVLVQREWADNAVSNTLYFKPEWSLHAKGNLNFESNVDPFSWNDLIAYSTNGASSGSGWKFVFDRETDDFKIFKYNPDHEEHQLESVLAHIAPLTKSVSLLPHSEKGIFAQMPEEGISYQEFMTRKFAIKDIDWSNYYGGDGQDEKYCTGDSCLL